jgi:prepilin-type processing-associated H-X9-DG protein
MYFVLAMEPTNLKRWHGTRQADPLQTPGLPQSEYVFDPTLGPLFPYLGSAGITTCPAFTNYVTSNGPIAYDEGAGSYGYNETYVGGDWNGFPSTDPQFLDETEQNSVLADRLQSPSVTVMFTDAACMNVDNGKPVLIEYSFSESPLTVWGSANPPGYPWGESKPSIAFRHDGRANVAYTDGHVDSQVMSFSASIQTSNGTIPEATVQAMGLGWWGTNNNDLFVSQ